LSFKEEKTATIEHSLRTKSTKTKIALKFSALLIGVATFLCGKMRKRTKSFLKTLSFVSCHQREIILLTFASDFVCSLS